MNKLDSLVTVEGTALVTLFCQQAYVTIMKVLSGVLGTLICYPYSKIGCYVCVQSYLKESKVLVQVDVNSNNRIPLSLCQTSDLHLVVEEIHHGLLQVNI